MKTFAVMVLFVVGFCTAVLAAEDFHLGVGVSIGVPPGGPGPREAPAPPPPRAPHAHPPPAPAPHPVPFPEPGYDGSVVYLRPTNRSTVMDIDVGLEGWGGDLTYRIGGQVVLPDRGTTYTRFPLSELEFPMEVVLLSGKVGVEVDRRWHVEVRGAVSLSSDAGTVYNSDWGIRSGSGELDVFSESAAELDVWEIEGWAAVVLARWPAVTFSAGVGYLYQSFDYEVRDLAQRYPSMPGGYPGDRVGGLVGTYEATVDMPYVGVAWEWTWDPPLELGVRVGIAPYVQLDDEDHHLLRSKVSYADGDGVGGMLQGDLRYPFPYGWYTDLVIRFLYFETDGTQVQYEDGTLLGSIEQETESAQVMLRLAIGRVF